MLIRTLILIMLLPTTMIIPDKEAEKCYVCVESLVFRGGKIFVFKSELLLPSNVQEVLLYGNQLRRKRVWIEVYVATPWGIKLQMIINGKVIPATTERFEFDGIDKEILKQE